MKTKSLLIKVKDIIMESERINKSLGDKLSRKTKLQKVKEEIKPIVLDSSTSKYFSPVQTRNQRKVKIEYEIDVKAEKPAQVITIKAEKSLSDDCPENKQPKVKLELTETTETTEVNKKCSPSANKTQKWEPENWEQIYENLKIMRSSTLAPVDTMGCDKCSDEYTDEKTKRYHVLVSLMLSSQTKDQVTYGAMRRLREHNLQPSTIAEMDVGKLEKLLIPVGFYRNKAKYLKQTAEILIEKYNSDIPNTINDLIKLPGVGPKMAHICMNSAWNIVTGIGVDVHVHRISNRLGWVRNKTKEPEKTRIELESWLSSDKWSEINHLLVGFGQTICTPVNPRCANCLNKDICPSAFAKVSPKKSKTKKKEKQ